MDFLLDSYRERFPAKFRALAAVADALGPLRSEMLIVGSTALFLWGADVEPHDIDLLTTAKGAVKAGLRLSAWEEKPVAPAAGAEWASHRGVCALGGERVEILGGLRMRVREQWVDAPVTGSLLLRAREQPLRVGDHSVLVDPLEDRVVFCFLQERYRPHAAALRRAGTIQENALRTRAAEMHLPAAWTEELLAWWSKG